MKSGVTLDGIGERGVTCEGGLEPMVTSEGVWERVESPVKG